MFRRLLIPALALLAALAAVEPASAQRGRDRDRHDEKPLAPEFQRGPGSQWSEPEQNQEVPLKSIVRDLGRQYGGRLLDSSRQGNRWVISWITQDGRRLTIEADATTGRILSTRG